MANGMARPERVAPSNGRAWRAAAVTAFVCAACVAAGTQQARATPRIVNGVLTASYPTVGALLGPVDLGPPWGVQQLLNCSGTMIGCETFVTAAHCFCPPPKTGAQCQGDALPPAADYVVFLQHGGFFGVSSIAVHPAYRLRITSDVAVVKLSSPVTGIAPSLINTVGKPPAGVYNPVCGCDGVTYGNECFRLAAGATLAHVGACP